MFFPSSKMPRVKPNCGKSFNQIMLQTTVTDGKKSLLYHDKLHSIIQVANLTKSIQSKPINYSIIQLSDDGRRECVDEMDFAFF